MNACTTALTKSLQPRLCLQSILGGCAPKCWQGPADVHQGQEWTGAHYTTHRTSLVHAAGCLHMQICVGACLMCSCAHAHACACAGHAKTPALLLACVCRHSVANINWSIRACTQTHHAASGIGRWRCLPRPPLASGTGPAGAGASQRSTCTNPCTMSLSIRFPTK